jgi:hypothetical protein
MQNSEFNDWCEENGVRINRIIHIAGMCSLHNHSILKSLVDDDAPIIREQLDLEVLDYIYDSHELAKKLIARKILGFFVEGLMSPGKHPGSGNWQPYNFRSDWVYAETYEEAISEYMAIVNTSRALPTS